MKNALENMENGLQKLRDIIKTYNPAVLRNLR